ncbi:MAG: hypothetical protein WDZ77_01995 [Candidatus Pacearchaeota archaeon]
MKISTTLFFLTLLLGILFLAPLTKNFGENTTGKIIEFSQSEQVIKLRGISENINVENSYNEVFKVYGTTNEVHFAITSNPKKITLGGSENTIYLCEGIHNPEIEEIGIDGKIIYKNC